MSFVVTTILSLLPLCNAFSFSNRLFQRDDRRMPDSEGNIQALQRQNMNTRNPLKFLRNKTEHNPCRSPTPNENLKP